VWHEYCCRKMAWQLLMLASLMPEEFAEAEFAELDLLTLDGVDATNCAWISRTYYRWIQLGSLAHIVGRAFAHGCTCRVTNRVIRRPYVCRGTYWHYYRTMPVTTTPGRSIEEALSELGRELQVRVRCFPRWVKEGKMSAVEANDRLQRHEAAIQYLEGLSKAVPEVEA